MRILLQLFFIGKDTVLHQQIVTADRLTHFSDIISMVYAAGRDNRSVAGTKSLHLIRIGRIIGIERISEIFRKILLRSQSYLPSSVIHFTDIHQRSTITCQMRNRNIQKHIGSVRIVIIYRNSQQPLKHLYINTGINHRILFPAQILIFNRIGLIAINELAAVCSKYIIIDCHKRQMVIVAYLKITGNTVTCPYL